MFYAHLRCVLAAILLSVPSSMAQLDPITVDQLVTTALERNREFLAAKQRLAEAQGLLRQAGMRPASTIEVEGATGRPLGNAGEEEFTIGYFKPVETSGKRDKRIQVAISGTDLAQADVDERARQLQFEVKSRYLQAVKESRKLEVLNRALVAEREYFQLTKARVDRGDAAPLEADLFAADLSRTEVQEILSTGHSESSIIELKEAVGLQPGDALTVQSEIILPAVALSLAELQQRAIARRPDLRAATTLHLQAQAELNLAEAGGHPDLTLSAKYSRRNSRFDAFGLTAQGAPTALRDADNVLTLGLSIPAFSKKQNQGNVEAARARLTAVQLRREHLAASVLLEVDAALRQWAASRRAMDMLAATVLDRSQRNLEVVRQAYELGQLRILDVLNEQRRVLDIELSLIDAQSEAAKAFAELERAVGGNLK
jgi:cobalt-zinc-cadmium efflux system outer membrane protein